MTFALPPSEVAVHPTDDVARHELFLMCDDVRATVEALEIGGIEIRRTDSDQGWGL